MKYIRLLLAVFSLFSLSFAQELPDAPLPQKPKFFTTWKADKDEIRTNREVLHSPSFLISNGLMWGVVFADIRVNRHNPNNPNGGELYVDAMVPAAFATGAAYIADRFLWRPLGLGFTGIVTFKHLRGAITGVYP
jgi:hypothetical protein